LRFPRISPPSSRRQLGDFQKQIKAHLGRLEKTHAGTHQAISAQLLSLFDKVSDAEQRATRARAATANILRPLAPGFMPRSNKAMDVAHMANFPPGLIGRT
jgi:hypothetical protein